MEQVEKVRRLYLRRADEVERRASELKNEREQDALLDETVANAHLSDVTALQSSVILARGVSGESRKSHSVGVERYYSPLRELFGWPLLVRLPAWTTTPTHLAWRGRDNSRMELS